jgi:transposase-like protein
MTGLHERDGPPSMSVEKVCPKCGSERTKHSKRIAVCYACGNSWLLENICPECESEMEMTQVYESLGDFYSDGPYHWEWKCPKCGHAEAKKK